MFPHEVQEILAKILFIVFSVSILCLGRLKAEPLSNQYFNANTISKTYTIHKQ